MQASGRCDRAKANGTRFAFRIACMTASDLELVALGLKTSKHGDYAAPLPKRYEGWAAALGWPSGG